MDEQIPLIDRDRTHILPMLTARVAVILEGMNRLLRERFPEVGVWILHEGYRSPERQAWLYASGRDRPGRIVANMPDDMFRQQGLGVSFCGSAKGGEPVFNLPDEVWASLGYFARGLDLEWGGDWQGMQDRSLVHIKFTQYHLYAPVAAHYLRELGLKPYSY